jgi:transposase
MAGRKGVRVIHEIQRMKAMGLRKKQIARALGISKNTVKNHWESVPVRSVCLIDAPTDATAPAVLPPRYQAPWASALRWEMIKEAADQGEALAVWWEEHLASLGPDSHLRSVPYISFWREFKRRYPTVPLEFHKSYPPGQHAEVDYKGARPGFGYYDLRTGEFVQCELFGAVLCFSQLFFAEAAPTQRKADFLMSIWRSFVYWGGVPALLTPDCLKSAVSRADRYDPDLNPDFSTFCEHCKTAALPARPRKPKDKAVIEGALGVFWRWIRGKLKKQRFYSIESLNAWLRERVEQFNNRVQRKYGLSRRQKFDAGERSVLLPLPSEPYEICEWSSAKLHWDCFAQVGKNFFSAPYALRGKELAVRITPTHVEFFYQLDRVASHKRPPSNQQGRYFREDRHLPPAHQAILEFIPQKCIADASAIGPETRALIEHLVTDARHPLMYLRRCLGILRLKGSFGPERLERACRMANSLPEKFPKLQTIEGVLKNQASQATNVVDIGAALTRGPNPNLRGQNHWVQSVDPQT